MKLIAIMAALTIATAGPAVAQATSPSPNSNGVPETATPPNAVGNGTAKALGGSTAPDRAGDRTDAERDRADRDKAVVNQPVTNQAGAVRGGGGRRQAQQAPEGRPVRPPFPFGPCAIGG